MRPLFRNAMRSTHRNHRTSTVCVSYRRPAVASETRKDNSHDCSTYRRRTLRARCVVYHVGDAFAAQGPAPPLGQRLTPDVAAQAAAQQHPLAEPIENNTVETALFHSRTGPFLRPGTNYGCRWRAALQLDTDEHRLRVQNHAELSLHSALHIPRQLRHFFGGGPARVRDRQRVLARNRSARSG